MFPKKSKSRETAVSAYTFYKKQADEAVTLQIFDLISTSSEISERKISIKTGLATGLIHSFMRRVIKRGWIRAKQVSAKRWLYFLTPEGFTEKSRITMNYLSKTLHNYRMAQDIVRQQIALIKAAGHKSVAVAGDGYLAEIVIANIMDSGGVELVAVLGKGEGAFANCGVVQPYERFFQIAYDSIFVCDPDFLRWSEEENIELAPEKTVVLVIKVPLLSL